MTKLSSILSRWTEISKKTVDFCKLQLTKIKQNRKKIFLIILISTVLFVAIVFAIDPVFLYELIRFLLDLYELFKEIHTKFRKK